MLLDAAETKRTERVTPAGRAETPAEKKETIFAGTIADSALPADYNAIPPASDRRPNPDEATSAQLISCPYLDCGYPYSSQLKACPRCKRPAGDTKAAGATKPNPVKGTIDPYRIKAEPEPPLPSCWLLPVTKTGEKAGEAPEPVALTYTAQSIELNRDMLEPGNASITGKVQAQLSFKDGVWQLKDQSELQTTFLQVSAETTLKEGDIILFGDRKFIFSLSNPQD